MNDFLVIHPVDDGEGGPDYRRAPSDAAATGRWFALPPVSAGKVEVLVNCVPLFGYALTNGQWSYDGEGYQSTTGRAGDGDLPLTVASR